MSDRRNHRVVIQVTDDEIADETLGSAMATMLRPNKLGLKTGAFAYAARIPSQHFLADIDVLNFNTLSLTKKNRQGICMSEIMNFDCVGRTDSDPLVRNELVSLFDVLLIDQQNCALVHFKPMRDSPTNFFNNVLVPEVDRRLALLRSTWILQYIKLEYYDVQKYDVVNMFQKNRKSLSDPKSELIFHNTGELLRWTQRAYINLWSNGAEHECFEIEFVFIEAPNDLDSGIPMYKTSRCKLSIQQFYINKIDGNMRVGLQSFFENMTPSPTNQSIITDYLREYFLNNRESWIIWMFFDVPQVNYGSSLANDMLTLAKTVYSNIRGDMDIKTINNDMDSVFMTQDTNPEILRQLAGGRNSPVIQQKPQSRKISFRKVSSVKMENYSLSFWCCRIEESFINVVNSMEKYYDRKYQSKIQKICSELKNTTRNIDSDINLQNYDTFDEKNLDPDLVLQSDLKKYRDALSEYRLLVQKVKRSKHADQLNEFITLKNIEISKNTREMKIRLLELCKARLMNAIKDEVKTLYTEGTPSVTFSGFPTNANKRF